MTKIVMLHRDNYNTSRFTLARRGCLPRGAEEEEEGAAAREGEAERRERQRPEER